MSTYTPTPQEIEERKRQRQIRLSRRLSWLLRHGAKQEHLEMTPDGYVFMNDIIQHRHFKDSFTFDVMSAIVQNDPKHRFHIKQNWTNDAYMIRANYGHSLRVIVEEKCVRKIESLNEGITKAVHATYYRNWPSIKQFGLQTMTRKHMHFALNDQLLMKGDLKTFRDDCELLIYLDIGKILQDGKMSLYLSENNIILCAGLPNGTIPSYYFEKVVDRRTGKLVPV